jgi:diguanylate cyclase (GGDEF)-like protein/PAS domain S-box-containing protein
MEEDFKFSDIVNSANDIVIVTKMDSDDVAQARIVYVNDAFEEITGYSRDEVIGKIPKLFELFDSDEDDKNKVRQCLNERKPVRRTIKSRTKSGEAIWLDMSIVPLINRKGEYSYFATIERDVTRERKLLLELEELSNKHHLTGLYNRRAMDNAMEHELARFHRSGIPFSYILLDLDHFKLINDRYGHPTGDKVLQLISDVIQHEKREYDFSARIGGEEFSILLPGTRLEQAKHFAERLGKQVSELCLSQGEEKIKITASFGVTETINDDKSSSHLYKRVDEALYEAKAAGRDCIRVATTTVI